MFTIDELLNCCPTNKNNYEQLIRLLRRNVVIPFVGAGFSANMKYPTWRMFLEKQSEQNYIPKIKGLLEENKYEEAASLLETKIHRNGLENVMLQTFGDHVHKEVEVNFLYESFSHLFQNIIITTNYDTVIETLHTKVTGEYIEKITPKNIRDRRVINQKLACGEAMLIKLHGDVAIREYVLTEEDYNKVYGLNEVDLDLPMPSILKDILKNKTILFLGCSVEKDRTLEVIEQIKEEGGMIFAILPLPESTQNKINPFMPLLEIDGRENKEFEDRKKFLSKHNIFPIWYPYNIFQSLGIYLQDMEKMTSSIFSMSNAIGRKRLEDILEEARKREEKKEINSALYFYNEAEELLKVKNDIVGVKKHIDYLRQIKTFYSTHGYAYEKKEIVKELVVQIEKYYGKYSLETVRVYQEVAYHFERYHYYKLMLKLFKYSIIIFEECEKRKIYQEDGKNNLISEKAFLYTNLGYAYLKNGEIENAKKWYQEAEQLLKQEDEMDKNICAFLYNGLFRYYLLEDKCDRAIETLDVALKIRRGLNEQQNKILPQHIVNTHSNKIHIYLKSMKNVELAMKEYEDYKREPDIEIKMKRFPDGIRRIKTDYGDILNELGKYDKAREAYKEALSMRKAIQVSEDLFSAKLYMKIAYTYYAEKKYVETLEYATQAYIINEKLLGKENKNTVDIQQFLEIIIAITNFKDYFLRIEIQKEMLDFRMNEDVKERENELIELFLPKEMHARKENY